MVIYIYINNNKQQTKPWYTFKWITNFFYLAKPQSFLGLIWNKFLKYLDADAEHIQMT